MGVEEEHVVEHGKGMAGTDGPKTVKQYTRPQLAKQLTSGVRLSLL